MPPPKGLADSLQGLVEAGTSMLEEAAEGRLGDGLVLRRVGWEAGNQDTDRGPGKDSA